MNTVNDLSSDHLPVVFEHNRLTSRSDGSFRDLRDLANANWSLFSREVSTAIPTSTELLKSNTEIDIAATCLTSAIQQGIEKAVPLKFIPNYSEFPISHELKEIISFRNYVRRIWLRHNQYSVKLFLSFLNKKIRVKINEERNSRLNSKLAKFAPNSSQLWNLANKLKNKNNRHLPPLRQDDGLITSDSDKKCGSMVKEKILIDVCHTMGKYPSFIVDNTPCENSRRKRVEPLCSVDVRLETAESGRSRESVAAG
ncbi:hypothetical protein DMENIID0001_132700 [Sergentomyia squamirostris]